MRSVSIKYNLHVIIFLLGRPHYIGACIWHMLTPKTGGLKEQAMRRDGVYTFSHDAAAAAEAAVPQSHERSSTQRALLWNQSESAARC